MMTINYLLFFLFFMDDFTINKKYVAVSVLSLFALLLLFMSITIVQPQEKAIKISLGQITDEFDSGVHFSIPFIQDIEKFNLTTSKYDVDISVNEKGAITKDNQTIGSSISVFYKLKADKIKDIKTQYSISRINDVINKTTEQKFKEVVGQNTIFDIAVNQAKISDDVRKAIMASVETYPFVIENVQITNYDWSDDFDKNIKETMNRAQQVKQKEQELLITEKEAQKIVKEAEAKKQAAALDADAKALTGEGIRKYNEEIAKTIDIEKQFRQLEIEKIRAEKWNGVSVSQQIFTPMPLDIRK